MALTRAGLDFLVAARRDGVDLSSLALLGRQALHATARDVREALAQADPPVPTSAATADPSRERFAEPVLQLLGADEITSLDASAFEGATEVVDLNDPLPDRLAARFTAVLDGGTLEHVFNFPRALQNAMEMVAPGGHLFLFTPTTGESGHGFYQLSPELMFRVLTPENGYRLDKVLLREEAVDAPWHRVPDPAATGSRVEFRSTYPTYLYVQATRVHAVELFRSWPQQSDYVAQWSADAPTPNGATTGIARKVWAKVPAAWRARVVQRRVEHRRAQVQRETFPAVPVDEI